MKNNRIALSTFVALCAGTSAFAADTLPNRLIVKFKSGADTMQALRSLNSMSTFNTTRTLGAMSPQGTLTASTVLVRYSTGLSPQKAAAELRQLPSVEWAQPDYELRIVGEGTRTWPVGDSLQKLSFLRTLEDVAPEAADPRMSDLWGMAKIQAPAAWAIQRGSRDVIVADIDTGVDYNHEDLKANMWKNPANPAEIGYDFANKDADPMDDQGHGTHTTGTIGAVGNNGIGVSGVAPNVTLMPIKFISAEGSGSTADAILSIDYAIKNGARIMSNSWGGAADDEGEAENLALKEAVQRAADANILFVAAAGNDGTNNDTRPMYPAAYDIPEVLSVASTSATDGRSFFSNYGVTSVDVGAPGSNIMSTVPGNKYASQMGTSMACPHVAGLAALILSERPQLTALQVKQIIMETVDAIPALQGKTVSGGRINAKAALERARTF